MNIEEFKIGDKIKEKWPSKDNRGFTIYDFNGNKIFKHGIILDIIKHLECTWTGIIKFDNGETNGRFLLDVELL